MSNQARLVLLSGTGGSGTTTLVEATAQAALDEGLRAIVIDAVAARVDDDTRREVGSLAQSLLGWLDADEIPAELWTGLGPARYLALYTQVLRSLDAADVDVVVVDCGSLREAHALIEFPAVVRRLLDAALTPTLAMRTPSAGEREAGITADFDALGELRDRLGDACELLESDRTTMRLVCVPEPDSVTRALRAQSAFALLGVQVEALILNRFSRKSDDVGRERLGQEQAQLERAERESGGSWVWKSTRAVRPVPKDRSVIGPFGGVNVLRERDLVPRAEDESYSLVLPLVGDAVREATVGLSGDELVVAFDSLHRWVTLPSLLRRCRPVEAVRTEQGLVVTFEPDSSLWRVAPDPEKVA